MMGKKFVQLTLLLLSGIIFSYSCNNDKNIDLSHINVDTKFIRTEADLQTSKSITDFKNIITKDSSFYDIYINEILALTADSLDSQIIQLQSWMQDSLVRDLWMKTSKKYGITQKIKKDLDQFFKYFIYYFPQKPISIPDIYTYISGFEYQLFLFNTQEGKDGIGLGLDMFLYPEIHYKNIDPKNPNFSEYLTKSWNEEHIVKKIGDLYIKDLLGEPPGHRLIDHMIHHGKSMFIMSKLIPSQADTILTEYTKSQLEWCQQNELQMWSFFLDKRLFFESNPSKIMKYINPSPDSPDMPSDAPGRTGDYLGWQIVKSYMNRYPETTLEQLIELKDSQSLLEKSKYKPKQR